MKLSSHRLVTQYGGCLGNCPPYIKSLEFGDMKRRTKMYIQVKGEQYIIYDHGFFVVRFSSYTEAFFYMNK